MDDNYGRRDAQASLIIMEIRTEFGRYGVVFNLHCENIQEAKDINEALELLTNYLYNKHGRRDDSYRVKALYDTLNEWLKPNNDDW